MSHSYDHDDVMTMMMMMTSIMQLAVKIQGHLICRANLLVKQ